MTFQPLQSAAESAERLKEGLRETPHNLQEVLKEVAERFFQHLPGVLTGLVIFLFFWVMARLTSRLVRKLAERARSDEALRGLLVLLTRFAVLAVGVLMALDQMGFEVSSTSLAAASRASPSASRRRRRWRTPSPASRSSRSSYRIGDTVTMAGIRAGQRIGLRSTRIRTFDQLEVIRRTGRSSTSRSSTTRSPAMRIDAPVQVAYGVPMDRVREVLLGRRGEAAGARVQRRKWS